MSEELQERALVEMSSSTSFVDEMLSRTAEYDINAVATSSITNIDHSVHPPKPSTPPTTRLAYTNFCATSLV